MRTSNDILRLAYKYMKSWAKKQPYKMQAIIINRYFEPGDFNLSKTLINLYGSIFSKQNEKYCYKIRDFIYKHDYLTPRNAYLMHPVMFLFYTYTVFSLCYKLFISSNRNRHCVDFSTKYVQVFYSGRLNFKGSKINILNDSAYTGSYNRFQHARSEFNGNRVLKIDIQNFFNNIDCHDLIRVLQDLNHEGENNILSECFSLQEIFKCSGYTTLPQIEGSMASSILSQIYLMRFTDTLNTIAESENLKVVRYVDDMYIQLPGRYKDTQIHALINRISSELWKYHLNLNMNKVLKYSINRYKKTTTYSVQMTVSGGEGFIGQKYVVDKAEAMLANDGKHLKEFWTKVCVIYQKKGMDVNQYHRIVNSSFCVNNDDANKVISSMIYQKNGKTQAWQSELSDNSLQFLLDHPEAILFDPAKFVSFLIQVEKAFNSRQNRQTNYVESYIHNVHLGTIGNDGYTIREGLIDTDYFIQNRKFLDQSESYIARINAEFISFIKQFF